MKITPSVQVRIRELLDSGMSTRKVAAEVGCSRGSVERISSPAYGERQRQRGKERLASFAKEHPLVGTWMGVISRTTNPHADNYPDYGGRGVTIYPDWLGRQRPYGRDGFYRFEAWILANLGPRPAGTTLNRVDNDGNYEPGNLKWSGWDEQNTNTRPVLAVLAERDAEIERLRARIAELESELAKCA